MGLICLKDCSNLIKFHTEDCRSVSANFLLDIIYFF